MANLSITATGVLASTAATVNYGISGAAITAGQVLYLDSSNRLQLAINSSPRVVGIALNKATAAGQPVDYVTEDDDFTPGATLAPDNTGKGIYVLSATAGLICPVADITTGGYPVVLFIAKSTTKAKVRIVPGLAALS